MKILQITWLLGFLLLRGGVSCAASAELDSLSARAIFLLEPCTGRVVYEKNASSRLYPASTTKLMTALVALERGRLEDAVDVGEDAAATEGSSMNLVAGERLHLGDLLYGMLLVSGNDATVAVADHLAGGVAEYAELMNCKAREIGAIQTHFVNSSGLPDPKHYSTAADLGRIAAYAYKDRRFREYTATRRQEVQLLSGRRMILENTNLLLGNYQGCNGMKTGYTESAGECLVASAERNGVHLVAVVMHAAMDRRFEEAAAVLDYGFQRIKPELAYERRMLTREVYVRRGERYKVVVQPKLDIFLPVLDGDAGDFSIQMETPDFVDAPIRAGQSVGSVKLLYKGMEIERMDMVADRDVAQGFSLLGTLLSWLEPLLRWFH